MTSSQTEVVIDTNVAVVANGKTEQAGPGCILNCIVRLRQVRDEYRVLLDSRNLILEEYLRNLNLSGQPGLGDAFFKWLFDNQANPEHCRRIAVNLQADRGFEEFPDDPSLSGFDQDDRKFVAVAVASGTGPTILNASDTDWWDYRHELRRYGVEVDFLCPELMMG